MTRRVRPGRLPDIRIQPLRQFCRKMDKRMRSGFDSRHKTMIRFSTMGKREHERGHIQGEQSISACIQPKHDKKQLAKAKILSPLVQIIPRIVGLRGRG